MMTVTSGNSAICRGLERKFIYMGKASKVLSYDICVLSKSILELGLISWPGEISPGSGEIHKSIAPS